MTKFAAHLLILATLSSVVFSPLMTIAQTSSGGQVIVSPAKIEVLLDPGEEQTIQIRVTNTFSTPITLGVHTEDIGPGNDQSLGAVLLGEARGQYSLRDYLHPLIMSFTVRPQETVALPVTIRLPSDLEPYGRYGSVIFSIYNEQSSAGGAQTIVDTRIGATIFVKNKTGSHESGELTEFSSLNHTYIYVWRDPAFVATFKNTGNVHLNPYGGIIVKNVFGLEKSQIEVPPWFVLPGATRTLVIPGKSNWLAGPYKAELVLNPGYGSEQQHQQVWVWVLSKEWIITLGVLLLAVTAVLLFRKFRTRPL